MTAASDLHSIITTWPNLADALTTQTGPTWPPSGRMTQHLTDLGLDEEPQRRARDGSGTREAPAPCRVDILDTMQAVREKLLDCADAVAEVVQRPPAGTELAKLRDRAHPARWRWTGTRPTAQYAALWLYGRVTGAPGPFRPLTEPTTTLITTTAAESLATIERALQLTRLSRPVTAFPCSCGGTIHIHGGDGAVPHLICAKCGRYYSGQLARLTA